MPFSDQFAPWPQVGAPVGQNEAHGGDNSDNRGPHLPQVYHGIGNVPPADIRVATQQQYQQLSAQLPAPQFSTVSPASQPAGSSGTQYALRQHFHPVPEAAEARGQLHGHEQLNCYHDHCAERHDQRPHYYPQEPSPQLPPSLQKLVNSTSANSLPDSSHNVDCCTFDNCLEPSCLSICDGFVDCEQHHQECTDPCMDVSCPEADASCYDYRCTTGSSSSNNTNNGRNREEGHHHEDKSVQYHNDYPFFEPHAKSFKQDFSTSQLEGYPVSQPPLHSLVSSDPDSIAPCTSECQVPSVNDLLSVPLTEHGHPATQIDAPLYSCQPGQLEPYGGPWDPHGVQQPCCTQADGTHPVFFPHPHLDFAAAPQPSQASCLYEPPPSNSEWTPSSKPVTAADSIKSCQSESAYANTPGPCPCRHATTNVSQSISSMAPQPVAGPTSTANPPSLQSSSCSPEPPVSCASDNASFPAQAPPSLFVPFPSIETSSIDSHIGQRNLRPGRSITSPLPSPIASVENHYSQQADFATNPEIPSVLTDPRFLDEASPRKKRKSMVRASIALPLQFQSSSSQLSAPSSAPRPPLNIFSIPEEDHAAPAEAESESDSDSEVEATPPPQRPIMVPGIDGHVCQCTTRRCTKLEIDSDCEEEEEVCKMVFPSEATLQDHLATEHSYYDRRPGQEGYHCHWKGCQRSDLFFSQRGKLQSHYITHSDYKAFVCDECGKKFSRAATLNRHHRGHLGLRPFKCPMCKKGFTDNSELTTHMRTHTGEKPHKCNHPGCNFETGDASNLCSHKLIHGARKHICPVENCKKGFVRSDQLKRHLSRTHKLLVLSSPRLSSSPAPQ